MVPKIIQKSNLPRGGILRIRTNFWRCGFLMNSKRERAFRRASENFAFWTTLALKCRFLFDFLPIENSSKIRHPKRQPKISKCRPLGAQGSIFESFWEPLRHRFSIKFRKRPKLIFCNRYKLILLFWHSKASHFGIKNQPKFHVFSGMVFGTPFSHFFKILCQKGDFGTPLRASWAQNRAQNRPSGAKMFPNFVRCGESLRVPQTTCFQDHFRSARGCHFGRILMHFDMILASFSSKDASRFLKTYKIS